MANPRVKALRTLEKVRLAKKQTQERYLAQHLKEYDTARQMLEMLDTYLKEYRTSLSYPVNTPCSAFDLEQKRLFLDKLLYAKSQQSSRLTVLEQGLERQKVLWRHTYKDHKAVANLADRIDIELMQRKDKDAQKELEEVFITSLNKAEKKK